MLMRAVGTSSGMSMFYFMKLVFIIIIFLLFFFHFLFLVIYCFLSVDRRDPSVTIVRFLLSRGYVIIINVVLPDEGRGLYP